MRLLKVQIQIMEERALKAVKHRGNKCSDKRGYLYNRYKEKEF